MSEKVEIFHFDDIANSYHGESLYCGLSSSLSLQVDKDCTITVYGQINPRSGKYFQLQVLNEETMKTSPNITSAGNYFVHIAGCYHVKFQVENATDVNVGGVFGKYHYPSIISAVFKDGNLAINNFSYDDSTKNFNIE